MQKNSAQSSSMRLIRGKHNWQCLEPLALITMFFPVMRHREKSANKSGNTGELQLVSGVPGEGTASQSHCCFGNQRAMVALQPLKG